MPLARFAALALAALVLAGCAPSNADVSAATPAPVVTRPAPSASAATSKPASFAVPQEATVPELIALWDESLPELGSSVTANDLWVLAYRLGIEAQRQCIPEMGEVEAEWAERTMDEQLDKMSDMTLSIAKLQPMETVKLVRQMCRNSL